MAADGGNNAEVIMQRAVCFFDLILENDDAKTMMIQSRAVAGILLVTRGTKRKDA